MSPIKNTPITHTYPSPRLQVEHIPQTLHHRRGEQPEQQQRYDVPRQTRVLHLFERNAFAFVREGGRGRRGGARGGCFLAGGH